MKLQHNVSPFIVVVVYNYRIAHFAEVFLNQLAQQVKLKRNMVKVIMNDYCWLRQQLQLQEESDIIECAL